MLESLAFALVKTFITFMFEHHLENMQTVRIEGAPGWYAQQTVNHICDSGFSRGDMGAVEHAKSEARRQMVLRLDRALEIVVYENFRNNNDPGERALIESFKRDENLPMFVESNVVYENIEYKESRSTAYARVCLTKERLLDYQNERVGKLRKSVRLHHSDRAFDTLDQELKALPGR